MKRRTLRGRCVSDGSAERSAGAATAGVRHFGLWDGLEASLGAKARGHVPRRFVHGKILGKAAATARPITSAASLFLESKAGRRKGCGGTTGRLSGSGFFFPPPGR